MYVDRTGVHCVLMSDHELFYVNWEYSERIWRIDLQGGRDFSGEFQRPCGLRCVEIIADDEQLFEILIGTSDG